MSKKEMNSPRRKKSSSSSRTSKKEKSQHQDVFGEIPASATGTTARRSNTTSTTTTTTTTRGASKEATGGKKGGTSSRSSKENQRPSSSSSSRHENRTRTTQGNGAQRQPNQEEIDQALALVLQQTYLEREYKERELKIKQVRETSKKDLELAHQLQESQDSKGTRSKIERKLERKDLELAKQLQTQDETAAAAAASSGAKLQQQDMKLAQKLFRDESRKELHAKRKQEQKDAALARRMQKQQQKHQEEEGSSHDTTISSLTQPPSVHRNHRRRRGGNEVLTSNGPLPRTHSVDETLPIASVPQRRRTNRSHRRPSTTGSTTPSPPVTTDSNALLPNSPAQPRAQPTSLSTTNAQTQARPTSSPANQLTSFFPAVHRFFPKCIVCNQTALYYISTLGNHYHPECFKCYGCHKPIDQTKPFAYTTDDLGVKYPLHRECYAQLYGITCVVCGEPVPTNENGRISYVKHPFFDKELMCPKHTTEKKRRRCTGCHRFEPTRGGFADLGDGGRCVCPACCRTVIIDNEEAQPLWEKVLEFFEHDLKLPIWDEMRRIPILIVGQDVLNEQMHSVGGSSASGSHESASHIMTRGLCLSEHQSGQRFALPRMRFDSKRGSFVSSIGGGGSSGTGSTITTESGYTYFKVPDPPKYASNRSNPNTTVTAILCLSGLPSDLTASILAHEATHAWIKLHPKFKVSRPLPLQVEEGCCQLSAMLFLTDGLKRRKSDDASYTTEGPSDEKLRQYFKFSIETDSDAIYGDGYRKAAQVYAKIGAAELLNHAVEYREFPKC